MNKNKIYLSLAILAVCGMIGQYMFYEMQATAQSVSKYTKTYSSIQEAKNIISQEESKGCSKIHHDYSNKDGSNGVLTFTCDDRSPPPVQQRTMTQNEFIQELASERGVKLVG